MIHNPILLKNVSLYFPHKICFQDFSHQIQYGDRIAIIGRNGSGKSSLLKIIQGLMESSQGHVNIPNNVTFGYIPQNIDQYSELSGGQRLNKVLTQILVKNPNVLCLDEPTNHLDQRNRSSLLKMLNNYRGTLIIVSHDVELLRTCVNEIWHIDEGKVHIFTGTYDDYLREQQITQSTRIQHLEELIKEKKKTHAALQFEQKRAAQGKRMQKDETDRLLKGKMKETASHTSGKKQHKIHQTQEQINRTLQELRIPEIIKPKFTLKSTDVIPTKIIVSVQDGSCGYERPILTNINLTITAAEHVTVSGDNGSGKSTLLKAFLSDPSVIKKGSWLTPKPDDIGYLDQHYSTLSPQLTVLQSLEQVVTGWTNQQVRKHLNDFLFRKNEEVSAKISTLSGGEKARLSLALIAAKTPKLLLLDEITNNLDLETKEYVIQILREYPGAMIIVSHDTYFLEQMQIDKSFITAQGKLIEEL